ncbi:hypothetical protein [Nocardia wallacei]|uniref:hypothetical protein n=1 Tax=Nocardia wallacei TaxID=480035 RepID=UPI0024557AAD|nr:hypothetical protein [Nocardia wallacei]
MAEPKRTPLEWARITARAYRSLALAADPEGCRKLDAVARRQRQWWVAPTYLPAEVADDTKNAVLSAKDIEYLIGVPAHSIWGWSSKGLLPNRGEPGKPKFLVSEVLEVEGRRRSA